MSKIKAILQKISDWIFPSNVIIRDYNTISLNGGKPRPMTEAEKEEFEKAKKEVWDTFDNMMKEFDIILRKR